MALLRVASDAQLVEEAPLEGIDWLKLPPLQKRGAERRTEAFTGVGVVLGIIAACVAERYDASQTAGARIDDRAIDRDMQRLFSANFEAAVNRAFPAN